MDCPVCRVPLTKREVEGVLVHFCPGCGGLLCAKETFRQYISALRDSSLQELSTAELFDRKAVPQTRIQPEGKMCPECGEAMAPFNYAYDSNIILDRCSECGLIWADRGEIVKVAQYVKGNPTIDSFGEALAEREVERAKYHRMAEEASEIGGARIRVAGFWVGLLPISDEEETVTIPLVTVLMIIVNIAIFMLFGGSREIIEDFGFIPDYFLEGREIYRLVTAQFLHVGLFHLVANMLFLWIFGDNVEDRLGKISFPVAYLFLGSVAALAHALTTTHPDLPAVGASGAISGVMGCYLVLFPQSRVKAVIGYYIVPVPAFVFLSLWFGVQLIFSLVEAPIAYAAHIGGFVAGLVVALGYRALKKRGKA
ncbi:rhomboid family intramembrane serine protease [bacterium]|nr:rhomboid family intramembrane serine protease [bacterium]